MINIKAQQTLVKFNKQDPGKWLYLMRAETYSQLTEAKVLDEAAVRSGIQRGALKGAWDAIGAVIKAWTTEGHSVAIPGLGSIRFSMNAKAVEDVNKVAKELIHTRKVVFTPSVDIKTELKNTKVSITCIDKDGKIVKRTTDESEDEVIDDGTGSGSSENQGGSTNTGGNTGGDNGGGDNGGGSAGFETGN